MSLYKERPMLSRFSTTMPKHSRSPASATTLHKRSRPTHSTFIPNKVASVDAAAAVDANPPLPTLLQAVREGVQIPAKGACIVYWMRMADLRSRFNPLPNSSAIHSLASIVSDNRALFMASEKAKEESVPLIILFAISPQDYIAHDRSARRIDFTLRNLAIIKASPT